MALIKHLLPKTSSYLLESMRFALLQTLYILGCGLLCSTLVWLAYYVRGKGIPLPLPVGMVTILYELPLFAVGYEVGKKLHIYFKSRPIQVISLSMLGQFPGFTIYFILRNYHDSLAIPLEIYKVAVTVFAVVNIVIPIMVILGFWAEEKG